MAATTLDRMKMREGSVPEPVLAPLPDLPDSLKKFKGAEQWWQQMKLARERDQLAINRFLVAVKTQGLKTGA